MTTPSSSPAPRKRLPVKPSEEHLRKQAKRLAKQQSLALADAQHQLARDYGCRNWAELMHTVEVMNRGSDQLADVQREVEPLPKAVRARDITLVQKILASGEFTQHDLDAGLAHAAWYGGDAAEVLAVRKALFDLLLDHGADPDGQYGSDYGPIIFGTGECLDLHGLQWLLDAGADATFAPVETKYGMQCPLSYWLGAYLRGKNGAKHRGVEMLLKAGAFVPAEVTAEILAVHQGDVARLGAMIDASPGLVTRIYTEMPYGNLPLAGGTLLHCAAEFGELACVELLLRRGAKEWMTDGGGKTSLDHARAGNGAAEDHHAIAELLDRPVIRDPIFKRAVRAIQGGDVAELLALLREHRNLVHERAIEPECYGQDYFRDPKLIWFVANNPTLVKRMPVNILESATALIDAGAEIADLNYTLGLVMTSSSAREAELQRPLMKLLQDRGAKVERDDLYGTLGHGERDAVAALLEGGMALTAAVAAGMGMNDELVRLLPQADAEGLHAAFSMAVINREVEAARMCLDAGADVNRFILVHKHSLPVHQATVNDDVAMLKLLVERGAKLDIPDALWNGTPLGWAVHTKKPATEAYLRSINAP